MKHTAKAMDMCHGPLGKNLLLFSIPLMFSNVLQVLFNLSDVAVVGHFAGSIALGCVGSTTILVTLTTGLLLGMSGGVNAVTARYLGAKDHTRVEKAVHSSLILCLIVGILLLLAGFILTRPILSLLGTKKELIDGAVLYLTIYLCGSPALAMYNYGNAILSAVGDTETTADLSGNLRCDQYHPESDLCHCFSSGCGRCGTCQHYFAIYFSGTDPAASAPL